jgi:hypothetical protein
VKIMASLVLMNCMLILIVIILVPKKRNYDAY